MPTVNRRATRDQLTKRTGDHLPEGIGGTITGGPVEPIDLMRILAQGLVSGGGAVSGAAQMVVSTFGARAQANQDIALSDGSRISFACVVDVGVLREFNDPAAATGSAGFAWSGDASRPHATREANAGAPREAQREAPRGAAMEIARDLTNV
jgi:hypothetical protein